jgi:hypothetical protein
MPDWNHKISDIAIPTQPTAPSNISREPTVSSNDSREISTFKHHQDNLFSASPHHPAVYLWWVQLTGLNSWNHPHKSPLFFLSYFHPFFFDVFIFTCFISSEPCRSASWILESRMIYIFRCFISVFEARIFSFPSYQSIKYLHISHTFESQKLIGSSLESPIGYSYREPLFCLILVFRIGVGGSCHRGPCISALSCQRMDSLCHLPRCRTCNGMCNLRPWPNKGTRRLRTSHGSRVSCTRACSHNHQCGWRARCPPLPIVRVS